MARILLNAAFVLMAGDVKQLGKYQFDAGDGTPLVDLVVWLEKSKANEKHPDGKPWIRLPKDNVTNRAYFSEDLFLSTAVNGVVEVEVKTAAPRILGATGVKQEVVMFLDAEQTAEYQALVDGAIAKFKAAKDTKKKAPEDMTLEELNVYIKALETGTKYVPAATPKSFLDVLTEEQYARYNELLAISAENKANAPKAPKAPMTEAQKAERAQKRVANEISKARALLEALRAASLAESNGTAMESANDSPALVDEVDEDYADED